MIQRIQSVYLFLVAVLMVLLCCFSPLQFVVSGSADILLLRTCDKWPMLVLCIAVAVLACVSVGMFRNRILQARLCVVNVFLNASWYAFVFLYAAYIVKGHEPLQGMMLPEGSDYFLTVWNAIPLVNVVLNLMALRRILKDEALVRAADRLR